ncbi:NAD(P)/FAD-dependent oxidoreductase [Pleionea mediterranea]|uniref:Putative NAD/FAD-binding protein n=1 Tax=Pleionea mediterranea TaxID=523701 RepID=A0A316FNB7_9GAMM|nr:FAD-dependent oxidoreductase [Pleionea mediterranea]PWK50019.1 putative NAD/FAD-binding protein [Pleionea mediterranea]
MKRLAIIGSGISGLACAHYLQHDYDITLFEKNNYVGGHTATKRVVVDEGEFDIDTGFIVFNDWTYPNFNRLLKQLSVDSIDTEMGFSVSCDESGLEYSGGSLMTLFAQKKNLLSIKHWRLIRDILTFNKRSKQVLLEQSLDESVTLGQYLKQIGLSKHFSEKYLIPMGAAIWSSGLAQMEDFPALYFLRFFKNHGLLNINDRPQWSVVKGGSKQYVDEILNRKNFHLQLNSNIESVVSQSDGIAVQQNGSSQIFDEVIFACHSDEALALLNQASEHQKNVLGRLNYSDNEVVLHTDTTLLPKLKSTWSSWNYKIRNDASQSPTLSYSMNILQQLTTDTEFVVTLNDTDRINPDKILGRYQYSHPVYTRGTIEAQQLRSTINGVNNMWFCGAYWYAGFHEDGIRSALDVVNGLGVNIEIL